MLADGLRIVFDPAIDRGAWPGPLRDRAAVVGEAWLGPLGLLDRLETELGLGGLYPSQVERACALASRLTGRDGWWRASFEADPIGTCERLLHDRDLLALWGWRGESASDRLAVLRDVTDGAPPGFPDRLHAIVAALVDRRTDIASIDVMSPIARLAPAWRVVFERLVSTGVAVTEVPLITASATGDLAMARTRAFTPTGDGTLTLLRPHGPLAAADEVAAGLAALPSLDGVLVIGADPVLDAALHWHGLPRLGAPASPPASTALIRLVIEAAFEPMEPADLHALLCLDPGPVPRRVGSRLVGALGRNPGRRSPAWREALAEGLARCDDDKRADIDQRLQAVLTPAAARQGAIDATEISRRLHTIASWARGRMTATPSLWTIARLAEQARRLIDAFGARELSLVTLRRLCDELDHGHAVLPGEVGIASVADPGAVLAPASIIIWWCFTRDGAARAPRLRLTNQELAGLVRLGVTPPDLGAEMEDAALRWRRPLEMAARALVLVCPQTGDTGDPSFPHPLWDELCAAMPDVKDAARLEHDRLRAKAKPVAVGAMPGDVSSGRAGFSLAPHRVAVATRALPIPTIAVRTGAAIPLRERESPSSLESLLGCSLAWALRYHGRLRPGMSAGPGVPNPLLYGNLAHQLLEQLFAEGALDAGTAAIRAQALIDLELANLCESLALPRYQLERTAVTRAIVESARELGALMTATGATVRGVEVEATGTVADVAITGYADLVLSSPDAILDLKWGHSGSRDKLISGTALQLAIYRELLGGDQVAYFALQRQELIAPTGSTLPQARTHGTATPRDTMTGALAAIAARRVELAGGNLVAPGAGDDEVVSILDGGRLVIAPSCDYCAFGGLCGRTRCT